MTRLSLKAALGLVPLTAFVGCSFPEHSFIEDSEFYQDGGASGGNAGAAGNGASGGTAGNGGVSGSAGAGGSAGTAGSAGVGGSAGTAGSAGTGGSAGAAGTGGSGGGETNCSDGVDNDADSDIDCADTDCQSAGYQCVGLPDGWEGPVAVYEGAHAATPPTCGGEYPLVSVNAFRNPTQPASCSACQCGSPSGVNCNLPPQIRIWESASCPQAGSFWEVTLDSSNCLGGTFPPEAVLVSAETDPPVVSGGSCSPSGGAVLPSEPWAQRVRGCSPQTGAPVAGGCGTNTCLPPATGDFNRGVCVYKQGDEPCPSASFSSKFLYHQSFSDQRTCTACSCGAPGGVDCVGDRLDIWDSATGCGGSPASTVTDPGTSCAPVTPALSKAFRYTVGTPSGGTCAPAGGQPTGTATAESPITFCCAL